MERQGRAGIGITVVVKVHYVVCYPASCPIYKIVSVAPEGVVEGVACAISQAIDPAGASYRVLQEAVGAVIVVIKGIIRAGGNGGIGDIVSSAIINLKSSARVGDGADIGEVVEIGRAH